SSLGFGEKTSTCAPAAESNSAFPAAAAVPSATMARLLSSEKKTGKRDKTAMRGGVAAGRWSMITA
ncbi:MAG: hypothetical protein WAM74_20975, partial [Xanthobacteraceae bacterium]